MLWLLFSSYDNFAGNWVGRAKIPSRRSTVARVYGNLFMIPMGSLTVFEAYDWVLYTQTPTALPKVLYIAFIRIDNELISAKW